MNFLHISIKDSFYLILCEFFSNFQNSVGFYQFNRAKQLQFSCKVTLILSEFRFERVNKKCMGLLKLMILY